MCDKFAEAVHSALGGHEGIQSVTTNVQAQLVVVEGTVASSTVVSLLEDIGRKVKLIGSGCATAIAKGVLVIPAQVGRSGENSAAGVEFKGAATGPGAVVGVGGFGPVVLWAGRRTGGGEGNCLAAGVSGGPSGVGRQTGQARMVAGDNPDAGYLEYLSGGESHADAVPVTSIDDYCRSHQSALGPGDLIKADAEGADLDVLLGAEEQIRNGAPQLAITTYHVDDHAERMIAWLRETRPDYSLRLKGFSFWTAKPRPVLLQASTLP